MVDGNVVVILVVFSPAIKSNILSSFGSKYKKLNYFSYLCNLKFLMKLQCEAV
jgi:hypothetical protein